MSYNIPKSSIESKLLRSYNFESDDESHINSDDLSELSDVFMDSDNDRDNLNSKLPVEFLSIDDIPYDRDLKWINVPNGARPKALLHQNNHLMRQVRNITKGNAAELAELDQHYIAMDERKRNHENKFLVEVDTDSSRNRHKEIRNRKGGRGNERGVDATRGRKQRSDGREGRGRHTDRISDEEDYIERNQQAHSDVRRRGHEKQGQGRGRECNRELHEYKHQNIKNTNGKYNNKLEQEQIRYSIRSTDMPHARNGKNSGVSMEEDLIYCEGRDDFNLDYNHPQQQRQQQQLQLFNPYDSYHNSNNSNNLPLDGNNYYDNSFVVENHIDYAYIQGKRNVPQNIPQNVPRRDYNHNSSITRNIKQHQQQQSNSNNRGEFYQHPNTTGQQQRVEYISNTKSKYYNTNNTSNAATYPEYNEYDYYDSNQPVHIDKHNNTSIYNNNVSYTGTYPNYTNYSRQQQQQQYSSNKQHHTSMLYHDVSLKDTTPTTTSTSKESSKQQLTPTAPSWEPKLNPTAAEFVPNFN